MIKKILIIYLCLMLLVGCAEIPINEPQQKPIEGNPETAIKEQLIVFDVGQGSSSLLDIGEYEMLIDCGGNLNANKLDEFVGDSIIESTTISHGDKDHIERCDEVAERFGINEWITNNIDKDTTIWKELKEVMTNQRVLDRDIGRKTYISSDFDILLFVAYDSYGKPLSDYNDNSVVVLYRPKGWLIMGDCGIPCEKQITQDILDYSIVPIDTIVLGHHGSKTATSDEFLDAIKPRQAIISVGKDNQYGHPHPEVLEKLNERGIKIRRTDQEDDIIIT